VLVQFTLGVTEDHQDLIQDLIPPSTKPLRQRRCGHCLLQVHTPPCEEPEPWPVQQVCVPVLSLIGPFPEQQPMRSKHCQTCRHCVRRYDHHCPWIENCVGERNHRWFLLYLAVQLLVLLWGLHIAW